MRYGLNIASVLLATIPLLSPTGQIGPESSDPVETGPVLDSRAQSCGQYPFSVNCYANFNFPHQTYYACFPTLCDAVAAGAYQCRKKFKSTCEVE